ncbi:hypothetical protein F7734_24280 [Scytonema sp. UIC 10036]|nr:hypothetical protein [Scytonema sp. UIC 10036]MUG95312.1 hypothetical protein [Scytonema sp. UIC 10036]
MSKNGNGHRRFFNPVRVFLRLLLEQWEKRDLVKDETYLINSDAVKDNLDDMSDEDLEQPEHDRN